MAKRPHTESRITGGDEDNGRCVSTAVLYGDIRVFSETAKLPENLGRFVRALEADQVAWYEEMSEAYSTTPLQTPEDGTKFIWYSLHKIYPHGVNVTFLEDLLDFYGLPHYSHVELTMPPSDTNERRMPHKFIFVLETLPVTRDQVTDGGGFTVFVEVMKYDYFLSSELLFLVTEHRKALFKGDKSREHELLNQINATDDYKIVEIDKRVLLTRKYQIRLRGIDGIEARDELLKMVNGKCLKIDVYYLDDKGCCIGDVYCDGTFLQDKLLEKGFEMHPDPELAEWALGMESMEDVLGME